MDIDLQAIYAIILSIIAVIGGAVAIPKVLVNGMQKVLTVIDNKLIAIVPKNDEQKDKIADARAFIDCIYTAIADGQVTLFEIQDMVAKAKVCLSDIENYKVPVPGLAPEDYPTLKAMVEDLQKEIIALKAHGSVPK